MANVEGKPGYKWTKLGWIPEQWDETQLKKVSNVVRGASPRPAGNPLYFNGDYLPWVTVAELTNNEGIYLDKTKSYLTRAGAEHTRTIERDTVLLANSGATLGVPKILRVKAGANDGIAAFLNLRHVEKLFLYYFLQKLTRYLREHIAPGMGQPNLNTTLIGNIFFPLPPLPEQRKIAQILSTWDTAIEKLDALIEKKRERKKGLMQQLLTGKRRFREFVKRGAYQQTKLGEIPMDWDYVGIGKIGSEASVKNPGNKVLNVLSCTKHHGLVDSLEYFGRQMFSKDTSTYKIVRRGQFAYATNHIEEGSIGYQDLYDEALISPMYTVFMTNNRVNDTFLFSLLKTERYRQIFERNTSGTINRRGSLRWKEFSNIHIPLPPLPEQQKIATVLSTADREIETLETQRDALKTQKRGLMQKLLTGQVRVK